MSLPEPIRWGILGTARIAAKIARAIHAAEGAELVAVASRALKRAQQWGAEHGAYLAYGSYEALLDDAEIDAVYVPLPPSLHAEWTIRAAERRKHVLCEKPLAVEVGDAEAMRAACREHGVQLMDGVMWIHHPRTAEMRRAIDAGELGPVQRVTSAFTFLGDRLPPDDHRFRRELGGGALADLGWYCIRATLWAFGTLPWRVFGTARLRSDVDIAFSGLMWFDGDRTASFDCGYDISSRRWLEVVGPQGSLVCDDFTRPWKEERPRFWLHGQEGKVAERVSAPAIQEVAMIEAFCRQVRSGVLNEEWPRSALDVQRVCCALDASARGNRMIDI